MYDTGGGYSVCREQTTPDPYLFERLNWLHDETRLSRAAPEAREASLMLRPVATCEALAVFGRLLGLLVPAAIFQRLFGYGLSTAFGPALFVLCVLMNAACFWVGGVMAARLAGRVDEAEWRAWPLTLLEAAGLGLVWAVVTGAAGGVLFFGVGALGGVVCAVPFGMAGFLLFVPLHRLLARGGMIDARHLWPLACGVTGVLAATVLSM